jgi:hypothetical protein
MIVSPVQNNLRDHRWRQIKNPHQSSFIGLAASAMILSKRGSLRSSSQRGFSFNSPAAEIVSDDFPVFHVVSPSRRQNRFTSNEDKA